VTSVRLKQSALVARMLLSFFRRRVLRAGVLESMPVRVFVMVAAVLLLGVMCTAAYFFLQPLANEAAVWRLLFDTSTVSLLLWVQVAFLLVKVLFINAERMLQFSYQLPVTNRERSMAFLMYEAAMTGIIATAGLISLAVSALILLGPSAASYIVASVILPVALTYLVLSVLYQLMTRLWILLKIGRMAGILNVLFLFVVLAYYSTLMTPMIQDISGAYLDNKTEYMWVTMVSWAWNEYSPWLTLAGVTLLSAVLTAAVFVLAPNQHLHQSRYLNLPGSVRLRGVLGPYDWCLLRSSQTVATSAMAVAVFYYLLLVQSSMNPMWGLSALSFGGLYQFTATQPLRTLPGARASAWAVYYRLIRAQLVLLSVFAVPAITITMAIYPTRLLSTGAALAACLGGSVMTTCISIVFPAEKDNPFSVFVGLSVVIIVLGLSMIGLGLLRLPLWAVTACLVGAAIAFVWYAVQGIRTSESRIRNAQGTVGREGRHRVRVAHTDHGSGDAALSHVFNRT